MHNKICFLFVVLLTIVVRSTSADAYSRRGISALDRASSYDDDTDKDKDDTVDNDYSVQPTTRRNRYSPYGSTSNNYRSRSRGPSSYEDSYDSNDGPRQGYGPNGLEGGSYRGNGPNCYSLLDPIYPLFSDICGAVPQARYSLPNTFGHVERWQIAQALNSILGPSVATNPLCTRSLRLLLCPLLFPPCQTRYEAPSVLPCQPFCRVVKNQCASPSLDLLPCELLPPTSELCPINPTPYNSRLSPFASPFPLNGPFPPGVLPQSVLQSILAQSTLSPMDGSSSPFSSLFPSSPYSPGYPSSGGSSSQYSPGYPSSGGPSSPFSSYQVPPSTLSSFLSSAGISPSMFSSLSSPSGLGSSPFNQLLNSEAYMRDSSNPAMFDFPPMGYAQDYRRGASRYFPTPRSATERV